MMKKVTRTLSMLLAMLLFITPLSSSTANPNDTKGVKKPVYFEIQVLDQDTGRGIPLVELETIDHRRFVTDSAGRIAFSELDLMSETVFFYWKSHGYEAPTIEGYKGKSPVHGGIELEIIPGGKIDIRVKRMNIAERMYRVTGLGIYKDSIALGYQVPIKQPLLNAKVSGADGGTSILYKDKIFWGYGDTNRIDHAWGCFNAPNATSDVPAAGGLQADIGSDLEYFTRKDGFVKGMWPEITKGVVWPSFAGTFTVDGEERLVMYYTNRNAAWEILEHGLGMFDDQKQEFRIIHKYDLPVTWKVGDGWATFKHKEENQNWQYYGNPYSVVRVPDDIEALKNPDNFEAWSCLEDGSSDDPKTAKLLRDENGKLVYRWTKNAPPVDHNKEAAFIKAGLMQESESRFTPKDVDTGKAVQAHAGTVYWNEWRQKWIGIFISNVGEHSLLGDVYYTESDSPNGPFKKAVRIATHYEYSYYNPTYHLPLSQEGGKIIYFDGCYSSSFATSDWTERYDYNMLRYRLDLSDPRLQKVWED